MPGAWNQKPTVQFLGDYLPLRGAFRSFADVPIRIAPGLSRHHGALAQASNRQVEVDPQLPRLPARDLRSVLAHETVHLAQQRRRGRPAAAGALEAEAFQLAPALLRGHDDWPRLGAPSSVPLKQRTPGRQGPTPEEIRELNQAFEAATQGTRHRRLEHLRAQREYLRQVRQLVVERQAIETRRLILDRFNPLQRVLEGLSIGGVNTRPISIQVSPDRIAFIVQFQARFRGLPFDQARQAFATLEQNLAAGISRVWGQRLHELPSLARSREFRVTPVITLIPADAPRDRDYWLVDVDAGVQRAETDPLRDGGTMMIAPGDVADPNRLGHESLHLFGLIDRYIDNLRTGRSQGWRGFGPRGPGTGATRGDPLDAGHGPILPEDLEFLFAHLGVYERVILDEMPPYWAALLRHMGWGYAPRLPALLAQGELSPDPQRTMLEVIDRATRRVSEALNVEGRVWAETPMPVLGP